MMKTARSPILFALLICTSLVSFSTTTRENSAMLDHLVVKDGAEDAVKKLSPVVIVPAYLGSRIEAVLDKPSVVHGICRSKTDGWIHLWAGVDAFLPTLNDCWVDNFRLLYNNITKKTTNSPGVKTRVPGFGDTRTIEYLTGSKMASSMYLAPFIDMLVANGYVRNVSVRGAQYDFRKAQNEQGEYFISLKNLVEETYILNHESPVTLMGHSLGCLFALYFLNQQSDLWKKKYIQSFISLGGPWGGAVRPLKVLASGEDMDIAIISKAHVRDAIKTHPTFYGFLPTAKFWPRNESLIVTSTKNYSIDNLSEFFDDLDIPNGWQLYQDSTKLLYDLTPPRVKVYCLTGTGVKTPSRYDFTAGRFPRSKPIISNEDGDGIINRRSLDGCELWTNQQEEPVVIQKFPGVDHREIPKDLKVISYIKSILLP